MSPQTQTLPWAASEAQARYSGPVHNLTVVYTVLVTAIVLTVTLVKYCYTFVAQFKGKTVEGETVKLLG